MIRRRTAIVRTAGVALLVIAAAACGRTSTPAGSAAPAASVTTVASPSTVAASPSTAAGGGASASTTTEAAGVTRASFDAAGNAICQRYNALNDALPPPPQAVAGQATTQAQLLQLATYVDSSEKLESAETNALRALPHPDTDSAAFTKALGIQDSGAALETKIVSELRSGDTADALTGINTIAADGTAVNAPFDSIGLVTCGSGAN